MPDCRHSVVFMGPKLKGLEDLPASPFAAPWIKSSWHARITVVPPPDGCRVWGRELQGDCWLYHGWTNGKGHARVKVDGRGEYLHRVSLAAFHGIEIGQLDTIDHLCRNRNCFQPLHLESVTPIENHERGDGPAYQFKPADQYQNDNADEGEDPAAQLRGY